MQIKKAHRPNYGYLLQTKNNLSLINTKGYRPFFEINQDLSQ